MNNSEKYKTAEERVEAYVSSRVLQSGSRNLLMDFAEWLYLEAEEEILPCPFCGGKCMIDDACTNEHHDDGTWFVSCNNENCYYSSGLTKGKDAAIAKHNRMARAVMESEKEGEEDEEANH